MCTLKVERFAFSSLGMPSAANIFPYDQKAYLNVKERKRLPLCVLSVPTEPNKIRFPLVGIPAPLILTYTVHTKDLLTFTVLTNFFSD